jgi:pyrroloquinoline quinone biosynthesis protein D
MPSADEPPSLGPDTRPRLARGVRLQHSPAHGGDVLLAPERVFKADAVAVAVLKRCTGDATLGEIVDDLAQAYHTPRERVLTDVTALLSSLAERKMLEW